MNPTDQLHNLDLGAARYVEHGLSLALHEIFDIEILKSAALSLVATWPTLSHRMNFAVRKKLNHSMKTKSSSTYNQRYSVLNLSRARTMCFRVSGKQRS